MVLKHTHTHTKCTSLLCLTYIIPFGWSASLDKVSPIISFPHTLYCACKQLSIQFISWICCYLKYLSCVLSVCQAVFSQSEGLEGEASETHYYYPVTDATQTTMVENVQAPETLLTQSTPTGQLYVMMSPQDVLGGTNQSKSEPPRTSRDDKRRAQHNEVERRRRDKINNWIVQLSKTIPDCTLDATKNGQVSSQSKGGILSKACDYIQELRQSNTRLGEDLENLERLRMDNQLLRQEVDDWKTKNQMMRSQLRQNGIVGAAGVDPQ
uniref:Upstream stimulatory factor 1 n=1 Tax=Oncorhynchus kisutch TaxID=8019 RepID=A0A8C7KJC8_ONCKI